MADNSSRALCFASPESIVPGRFKENGTNATEPLVSNPETIFKNLVSMSTLITRICT